MKEEVLFTEKQKFRQTWLWITFFIINTFFISGFIIQVIGNGKFGNNPMQNSELVTLTIGLIILTLLFWFIKLETKITKEGIYVRFFPFHLKFKHYKYIDIEKLFLRQYSAIFEYGGWGLRLRIFGNEKAFTISGNKGLQLYLKTGKKVLIGTRKPKEMESVLENKT